MQHPFCGSPHRRPRYRARRIVLVCARWGTLFLCWRRILCSKRYSAHMHVYNLSQPFQIRWLLVFLRFPPPTSPLAALTFLHETPSHMDPDSLCSAPIEAAPPRAVCRCLLSVHAVDSSLASLSPPPRPRRPLLPVHAAASYQDRSRGRTPPPPSRCPATRRSGTVKAEAPAQARPRPCRRTLGCPSPAWRAAEYHAPCGWPNLAQHKECSIDALLDKTITNMLCLQSISEKAEK
jgi:hypothetical protein